ncbi:MAG: L-threonylcarbamoyladenylate synthase [Hyphomicrobiaceae bacterium]|nr:L-threonylcarbamoyladenylate synthase [Hyphomicrobiaceae bacterium]
MIILEATPANIAAAARRLRSGGLVAMPTETVYGLAADATNAGAVAAIFASKGRPRFNPLIAHVPSVEAVAPHAVMTATASRLARAFWPGPLTLVLARAEGSPVCDLVTAGLPTIAMRVPSHPVARALLEAADVPVAAPSANLSGRVSPTLAAHVAADLADCDVLVLDGGAAEAGLESTVVDASGDAALVLRLGAIARADLEHVLGHPIGVATGEPGQPSSPGMLARHYAPATPLRLNARAPEPGEAWLCFGAIGPRSWQPGVNLSPAADLVEAAANLFAALRALDAAGAKAIAVAPIPAEGLGEAINDRLHRASLGRA